MTQNSSRGSSQTVDADEVARFSAIAEEWWDPTGKFRPLHRINPIRLKFIVEHLCEHFGRDIRNRTPLDGLRVLDIGCGGGLLCEPMARLGAEITGIDASETNIGVARLHAEQSDLDIDYQHAAPEDLGKTGEHYDFILNMEVIEHVSDPDAFLEMSCDMVSPGGAMVLSTINRTVKAFALAKVGAEYVLRWLPAGTHDPRKFVKPSEMAHGLRNAGLELIDLKGMTFNPFRNTWSLSGDLSVNYLAFATKPKAA